MFVDIFGAAPVAFWAAIGFLVGLICYWLYRVCAIREHRAANKAVEIERLAALKEAQGQAQTLRTSLKNRDTALAEARAEVGRLQQSAASVRLGDDELRRLKYENWVLDTQRRKALETARVAATTTETRAAPAVASPAVEVQATASDSEALKYQNWLLRKRLGERTGRGDGALPAAAAPDGPSLRYFNWLLSTRLRDAMAAGRMGRPLNVTMIETALDEAEADRPRTPAAFAGLTAVADDTPFAASASVEDDGERAALEAENAGLRYRNWVLGGGLGRVLEAARAGDAPEPAALEETLSAAWAVEAPDRNGAEAIRALAPLEVATTTRVMSPPVAAAATAPVADASAADAAAETLRKRVAVLERELEDRTTVDKSADHWRTMVVDLRADLWASEWRRRRSSARSKPATAAFEPAPPVAPAAVADQAAEIGAQALNGALDEAAALRRRATLAENALRRLRAEKPAPAVAQPFVAAPAPQEANGAAEDGRLRRAVAEAAALRSELWSATWRAAASSPEDAPTAENESLQGQVRALQASLAVAEETRGRVEADALSARSELDDVATARDRAEQKAAALATEIASLRAASVAVDAVSETSVRETEFRAEIDRLTAETETLRVKLTSADDARRRLEAQLATARETEAAAKEAAQSALQAATRTVVETTAPSTWTSVPFSSLSQEVYDVEIAEADVGAMIDGPHSGAEDAALELIESEDFVASDANRPLGLIDSPDGEPDDLKLIRGVGPKLEGLLNGLGLYHFRQLAEFRPADIAWIDKTLAFRGRIVRDRWIPQATYWAQRRASSALVVGEEGSWTMPPEQTPVAPEPTSDDAIDGAYEAARLETVDTIAPTADEIDVSSPLSGAEAAALELIESGRSSSMEAIRPAALLDSPATGAPDDLKLIRGVGPRLEGLLNGLGVFYFDQFSRFSPRDIAWLDAKLAFRGRIVRDRWIPQASHWSEQKVVGALQIGAEGVWTSLDPDGPSGDIGYGGPTVYEAPPTGSPSVAQASSFSQTGAHLDPAFPPTPPADREDPRQPPKPVDAGPDWRSISQAAAVDAARRSERVGADAPTRRPGNLLAGPPVDGADDLKLIDGVGPKLEAQLNERGVFTFGQLAGYDDEEIAWLDATLGLGGRARGGRWPAQAQALAERRSSGEFERGVEGLWTTPSQPVDPTAPVGDARYANVDLTMAEADAIALIDGGFVAEAANRPAGLFDRPIAGQPDDLKLIGGVGPKLEALLNELGVYYYRQIANFTATDIAWLDAKLRFNGRIARDRWVLQAAELERRYRTA